MHAIGAFLHLAADVGRSDAEVAAIIDDTDPRKLLRAALPDCPRRLYRALDSAGEKVFARLWYERLGAVCRGPFADALLAGDLSENRIGYYEQLSEMHPATASLHAGIGENSCVLDSVETIVSLLLAHGVLREEEMRLPRRAGMPAVAK